MTTPSIDYRALAARPIPVVRLEDPWADRSDEGDPLRKEAWRAVREAAQNVAVLASAQAATMVRRVMPAAHLVVFDRTEDVDSGVTANLLAIRDSNGDLIWYDEAFASHPDAAALCNAEAYGGPVMPEIDHDTRQAIESLIEEAEDWGRGYYCRTHEAPYREVDEGGETYQTYYDGDLHNFFVDDEIERATKRRHAARSDRFWRRLRNYAAALVHYAAHH